MARAVPADGGAKLVHDLARGRLAQALPTKDQRWHAPAEAELLAQLQAVPVAEVDDVLLAVVDDLGPHVGELAVHALAEREDPAPDPAAGLQHHDLVAGRLDLGGGDQA